MVARHSGVVEINIHLFAVGFESGQLFAHFPEQFARSVHSGEIDDYTTDGVVAAGIRDQRKEIVKRSLIVIEPECFLIGQAPFIGKETTWRPRANILRVDTSGSRSPIRIR